MRSENGTGDQEKECIYCSFERYNLSREEAKRGYLRARPMHTAGAGRSFEEVYLRKESNTKFCLIVDASSIQIKKPIEYCPICGRVLKE